MDVTDDLYHMIYVVKYQYGIGQDKDGIGHLKPIFVIIRYILKKSYHVIAYITYQPPAESGKAFYVDKPVRAHHLFDFG